MGFNIPTAVIRQNPRYDGYTDAAFRAHPANDVFGVVAASITAEARAVPRGRFAMLRRSGMSFMVRFSPNRQFE
jgi:hypothetical protein